ncbi:MAG: tRNA (guanine-N7-)-methyltransferase [Candidatus Tokpelaia sp. JSC085]|nr:MAG: tRNA (guanine-N7-)-methyltransferase [Candidatus Tokpelaia sp. JSC085]
MIESNVWHRKSFFGRRKGKTLHQRQKMLYDTLLPALRINLGQNMQNELQSLFALPVKAVRLEIGFGNGESLLHEATRFRDVGFIGVEPFVNGMAKMLACLSNTPDLSKKIRLYDNDAIYLLDWLPYQSIDGIDLFYPDPWIKKNIGNAVLLMRRILIGLPVS